MEKLLPARHAISRARLFLDLADSCTIAERNLHEAYFEAAIIFCRAAMHRLQSRYGKKAGWKAWFDSLLSNPSVMFVREERDFILKDASPKVGQIIYQGEVPDLAKLLYYYEDANVPAVDTVRKHVEAVAKVILEGELKFGDRAEIYF